MRDVAGRGLGLESPDHIDASIVVLELRLRAEDHEEELLVRGVLEDLPVRADLAEGSLVHEVDHGAEVPGVSREAVGSPREHRVVPPLPEPVDELVEAPTLSRGFCGLALAYDFDHVESVAFCYFPHCFQLGVYRESLPLILLGGFPRVEAVTVRGTLFPEAFRGAPRVVRGEAGSGVGFLGRGECLYAHMLENYSYPHNNGFYRLEVQL